MSENTPAETIVVNDDLDAFSSEFFGQNKPEPEQTNSESNETVDEDSSAPDDTEVDVELEGTPDDEQPPEDNVDDLATDEDEETEEEPEAPAPKKNRFQERIDELVRERETEKRAREALEARLAALENPVQQDQKPKPTPDTQENSGPRPDDKTEDGEDKYPLGEFDPSFVRDLARHEAASAYEAIRNEEQQKVRQAEVEEARNQLVSNWQEKLDTAQERYPDFMEKGDELVTSFQGIDQAYGEHLTTVLMGLDHGPDVLYHLANNRDLADTIIKSGPTNATIALAELNAGFKASSVQPTEQDNPNKRMSNAPEPPPRNKGSAGGVKVIADDTDDLDAFETKFFKRK